MKRLTALFLVVAIMLSACTSTMPTEGLRAQVTKTYTLSSANFPNPERGFFYQRIAWDTQVFPWGPQVPLSNEVMRQARREGYTLLRLYYIIPEFRYSALSQEFLDTFKQHLLMARAEGVKLIPLFTYSFPTTFSNDDYYPDAELPIVLKHLDQLKPVIQSNTDAIAMWDAGFLGPWGEWHHSGAGHFDGIDTINNNSRQVMEKLLEVVPFNRAVTVRYPRQKFALFDKTPITQEQAFQGWGENRVGHKNDCYLTSANDFWGYEPDVQGQKKFLNQDNLFVPQQGETCSFEAEAQPYIQCDNAVKDMAYLRFSTLNINFNQQVIDLWKNQNCFSTIQKRLGYRFSLLGATLPDSVTLGSTLRLSLKIKNDGFANPYNGRGLAVVLRNQQTQQTYRITLASGWRIPSNHNHDPRFWQPGTTTTLSMNRALPKNLPKGNYDVLLHLFDPIPEVMYRPEFAIRLANVGTWESTTGYNKLLHTLTVQ